MSATRIFISSTCYDLAAVRESLREHIIQLGHVPLLSEYPSFPVNPSEKAIANCQSNVRKHSDILLLIIGGRRGFLDHETGKTVTNLEYETARKAGIACFVFVQRSVNTLLAVWKKNPSADFTPSVDHPEVFAFIERIRSENQWIFDFEKTDEIRQILAIQLSTMFRGLLERDMSGKLDLLPEFRGESEKAQQLARERPRFWEYLLTGELLTTKISEIRRRYNRVRDGLAYCPGRIVNRIGFLNIMRAKINDSERIVEALGRQISEIVDAWGPLGQPGDAVKIKQAVDGFAGLCNHLVGWEEDMISLLPPEGLKALKESMRGWTECILKEIETLPIRLLEPFKDGAEPSGSIEITLKWKFVCSDALRAELKKLETQD